MSNNKKLLYWFYFLLILDVLFLPGFIVSSFLIIGIPGLILTLWLLFTILKIINSLKAGAIITKKHSNYFAIGGLLFIFYLILLGLFLSGFQETDYTMLFISMAFFFILGLTLVLITMRQVKKYNASLNEAEIPTPTNKSDSPD